MSYQKMVFEAEKTGAIPLDLDNQNRRCFFHKNGDGSIEEFWIQGLQDWGKAIWEYDFSRGDAARAFSCEELAGMLEDEWFSIDYDPDHLYSIAGAVGYYETLSEGMLALMMKRRGYLWTGSKFEAN